MIKAFVFDLDGTLVQTEILKAISYAKAAVILNPSLTEKQVINGFKEVVGLSRKEVAEKLLKRFELEDAARSKIREFNVHKPWQAYVQVRMNIYYSMISGSGFAFSTSSRVAMKSNADAIFKISNIRIVSLRCD